MKGVEAVLVWRRLASKPHTAAPVFMTLYPKHPCILLLIAAKKLFCDFKKPVLYPSITKVSDPREKYTCIMLYYNYKSPLW